MTGQLRQIIFPNIWDASTHPCENLIKFTVFCVVCHLIKIKLQLYRNNDVSSHCLGLRNSSPFKG